MMLKMLGRHGALYKSEETIKGKRERRVFEKDLLIANTWARNVIFTYLCLHLANFAESPTRRSVYATPPVKSKASPTLFADTIPVAI